MGIEFYGELIVNTKKLDLNVLFMYAYSIGFMLEFDAPNHWATGCILLMILCPVFKKKKKKSFKIRICRLFVLVFSNFF